MRDEGGGGWELAGILWWFLGALLIIIGVVELIKGHHHPVTFWLVGGLAWTNVATLVWGFRRSRAAMGRAQPTAVSYVQVPHPRPGETLEGSLPSGPFRISSVPAEGTRSPEVP